jgi:hypothetical protein
MLRAPHCDIHCKNVRYPNGIRAACSGAERGAYESMSPQAGIRPSELTGAPMASPFINNNVADAFEKTSAST